MSTMILRALDPSLGVGRCEIPEGRAQTDVGRSADCAIVLPSKSVSRVHARFERKGAELVLQDLGSSNGTAVNGKPIQEAVTVHAGDRVRFGSLEFVLEEEAAPGDEAATILAEPATAIPTAPATTAVPGAPPTASTSELTPSRTPLMAQTIDDRPPESAEAPQPMSTKAPPPRDATSMTVAKVRDPATAAPAAGKPARVAPTPSAPATPFELALIATGAYVAVVAAGLAIRWALG